MYWDRSACSVPVPRSQELIGVRLTWKTYLQYPVMPPRRPPRKRSSGQPSTTSKRPGNVTTSSPQNPGSPRQMTGSLPTGDSGTEANHSYLTRQDIPAIVQHVMEAYRRPFQSTSGPPVSTTPAATTAVTTPTISTGTALSQITSTALAATVAPTPAATIISHAATPAVTITTTTTTPAANTHLPGIIHIK